MPRPPVYQRLAAAFAVLLAVVLACVCSVGLDLMIYAKKPSGSASAPQSFVVPAGQDFQAIAERLENAGIVSSPLKLRLLARIQGRDKNVRAGEYRLSGRMTPAEILRVMISGRVQLHRVTVPEGYNLAQIARLVSQAGFVQAAEFLQTAKDPALLKRRGIPGTSFEGYLFPETYFFARRVSPEKIITTLHQRFETVFSPEWRNRAKQIGFTVHQIVTLASIIEKETADPVERPLVASVFHNRLKKGMRLQSDPTVIYGIDDFDGNLTRTHLRTPTSYNTYQIKGLPPGPIANPGRKALEAALYPADTDYLYFVAKNDRQHFFSTDYRNHRRAVRKYQLRR